MVRRSAFLLALLTFAWGAASSPSINTKWTVQIPSAAQVALVSHGVVVFSSETEVGGQYNNTIQASTGNQSSLWTLSSFGHVASYTNAYAFPAIPKMIFLVVNNIQPPNVSAVVHSTGAVVWSTSGAFEAVQGGTLVSSVDGSTLYLFTTAPGGSSQMTALDSSSGEVLFTERWPLYLATPVRCGASGISCILNWTAGGLVFLDGRSGASLGSVHVPPNVGQFTVVAENLLLATAEGVFYMLNTTSLTFTWSLDVSPSTVAQFQSVPGGGLILLLANVSGFFAQDAFTGDALWNVSPKSVCPFASPAPGYAASFASQQYLIGQVPAGGTVFLFAVACSYTELQSPLYVLGSMDVFDGTLVQWRYLSYFPASAPIPVGSSYFILSPSSLAVDFYDSSSMMSIASYPPAYWQCWYDGDFSATVDGAEVLFVAQCQALSAVLTVYGTG